MDASLQYIPILIFGFGTSLGLTPATRQLAMRLGVVDKPNQARKTHKDHKPMMGGLAIYLALTVSVLLFSPPQHLRELFAIVGGAGMLALVGLVDDRYDLSWRVRFFFQFVAAFALVAVGIQIRLFGSALIDIPITLVWVVALTNATNFLDNMDGLTAGLAAIAAFFFLLIAVLQGQILVSLLAAGILGSAVGFLVYNFAPSSTFMGDMGALALGYLLAALAIKLNFAAQPLSVSWMVPVLVLALPIFDINLVFWTRLAEGRSPAMAGRDHTSHRIRALGLSNRLTVIVLYGACALFGAIGLLVSVSPWQTASLIGGVAILLLIAAFAFMVYVRRTRQLR